MSVPRDCWVLSGSGPCYGPITLPEGSYKVWCVSVRVPLSVIGRNNKSLHLK
jgi:hypothetical protein